MPFHTGRQTAKILICADKDSTAKEQHQVHCQNGRGGLDGAAIDSASEKSGTIALAEGRSGIGNQDRQRRCFHAACCRTWRTADEHQKDHTPCDAPDIADRFTVLKPAVLGVTD